MYLIRRNKHKESVKMWRQRIMSQMKSRRKLEAIDLPDAKLKALVVRMFKELRGKIDELSENIHKEIGNIKKNKSEITNTMN